MKTIGYATIDIQKYESWMFENLFDWLDGKWRNLFHGLQNIFPSSVYEKSFTSCTYDSNDKYDVEHKMNDAYRNKFEEKLKCDVLSFVENRASFYQEFSQRIPVVYDHSEFYAVKFGDTIIFIPKQAECISFTPLKNYDNLSTSELNQLSEGKVKDTSNAVISSTMSLAVARQSKADVDSKLSELKRLADMNASSDTIKSSEFSELTKMKKEIEEQTKRLKEMQQKMLDDLNAVKLQYEQKKLEMERKIFLLDAKIYCIRCYLGEVVDFVQIRSGRRCDIEHPLVIHQKFHYLDEEMGKLVSLYDFRFDDSKYFEKLIQCNDQVFETFCSSEKCISIVRVCRELRSFNQEPYDNILTEYKLDHGEASIGILVRGGENLWMGWTDHEKVKLNDDLFYIPTTEKIPDATEIKLLSTPDEIVSRYFLFNILYGLTNPSEGVPMLPLPEGVDLRKFDPNKYIVWSSADNALEDNRFGTLEDVMNMCNKDTLVGDYIISTQSIYPERSEYRYNDAWNNSRGVGERNRTRGISLRDNTIYTVNRRDYYESSIEYNTGVKEKHAKTKYDPSIQEYVTLGEEEHDIAIKLYFDNNDTIANMIIKIKNWLHEKGFEYDESHLNIRTNPNIYVSVLKDDSDYVYDGGRYTTRKRNSYSNFRVDNGEYINLTIMNSIWCKYLITNASKINGSRIAGRRINYSHFIPYLNKIMEFVRKRESEEQALISKHIDLNEIEDWQIKLSEWKLKSGHHTIGVRYAKQFANYLENGVY